MKPDAGETFAMKDVLELPPREFFSKKVNLESLYQICLFFSFFDDSASALITLPNTVKDLLI